MYVSKLLLTYSCSIFSKKNEKPITSKDNKKNPAIKKKTVY